MVFSFARARIGSMLMTSKALLRRVQRHLREEIREDEEEREKLIPALKREEEFGNVDRIDEQFKKLMELVQAHFDKLLEDEKKILVAEYPEVKHIMNVDEGLVHVTSEIEKMLHDRRFTTVPGLVPALEDVKGHFVDFRNVVRKAEAEMDANLAQEYRQVALREEKDLKGLLQGKLIAINEIQRQMDDIWRLRSDVRKEKRESKDVVKGEDSALKLLARLRDADMGQASQLIEELRSEERTLEKEIGAYIDLFHQTITMFKEVLFVCGELFFRFKGTEHELAKFEERLRALKYPKDHLKLLEEELKATDEEVRARAHSTADAARRAGRLARSKLAA